MHFFFLMHFFYLYVLCGSGSSASALHYMIILFFLVLTDAANLSLERTKYFLRALIRAFLESHITVTHMGAFLGELVCFPLLPCACIGRVVCCRPLVHIIECTVITRSLFNTVHVILRGGGSLPSQRAPAPAKPV